MNRRRLEFNALEKNLGMGLLLIIAVRAGVCVLLATYDYNNLKPRVARMVQAATGRELRIGGEIDFARGWSSTLVVTDIALSNASWGSQPQMITIDKPRCRSGCGPCCLPTNSGI